MEMHHYESLLFPWQHIMLATAALLDIRLFVDHGMHEKAYKQALLTSGGYKHSNLASIFAELHALYTLLCCPHSADDDAHDGLSCSRTHSSKSCLMRRRASTR